MVPVFQAPGGALPRGQPNDKEMLYSLTDIHKKHLQGSVASISHVSPALPTLLPSRCTLGPILQVV